VERLYYLALNLLPGVGPVISRRLLDHFHFAELIFKASLADLQQVAGIGSQVALKISASIKDVSILRKAETELAFIDKFHIRMLMLNQSGYPARLLQAADCPSLLFAKGNADLDAARVISIVGTRHATAYGKAVCIEFIEALSNSGVIVVSGLAWGIDICAHRQALNSGLPTIAVLGHGLTQMYPAEHRKTAEEMIESGALVTEFFSDRTAEKENFPKRNRIIAGLSDATVLIEAAPGGGALITAGLANSYDRDVYAFPGRITDQYSKGCLELIRDNQAQLITSAEDFIKFMNWDLMPSPHRDRGKRVFLSDPVEIQVMNFLTQQLVCSLDEVAAEFPQLSARLPAILMQLELKGNLRQLPGKRFEPC